MTVSGSVTVVVMTRDRWPDLRESLPRHEAPVVLVDNGSRDGTPQLVRRHFPDVEVVEAGRNLGAVARNIGVERARTPYVAFADDDSWWAPDALGRAADLFEASPRLGLVAARVLVEPDRHADPVSELMARSPLGRPPDLPGPSILGFLACAAVVRRRAFRQVGGFDDVVFFLGEEERLALDLTARGWGLSYAPSVVAHHKPSTTRGALDRAVRSGRNEILTCVMRRPWPVVSATVLRQVRGGPSGRRAVAAAVPRLPRALAHRQQVPLHVELARRLLD
jgi:GT2 family glycosyltransferase